MKRLIGLTLILAFSSLGLMAQSIDDLKKERDEKDAQRAELQGQADALAGEVASLTDQITKLSGWQTGLAGILGLNFSANNEWLGQDNSSSAFNFGLTAFANQTKDKFFWNNKGIVNKAWQDVDKTGSTEEDGLFDSENSVADIVNLSSLYGLKLSDNIAISALGELNTSVSNFFEIGTFDIGAGVTWTPASNLVVVLHPLNYHVAFAPSGIESVGALGAKLRADYTKSFPVGSKAVNWSSTFTAFLPYDNPEPVGVREWQWLNSLTFDLFNGIGVGIGFGLRDAEFDTSGNFYTIGLSYGF